MKKQILSGAFCVIGVGILLVTSTHAQLPKKIIQGNQTLTTNTPVAQPTFAALRGTLKADKKILHDGDVVAFTYSVTNTSKTAPQTVRFSSGQRFDIMVSAKGSTASVWQMSQTMRYMMSLGSVTFAPGETKTFTATWRPDSGTIKPGAMFMATAYLTAMGTRQPATASRPASAMLTLSVAPK